MRPDIPDWLEELGQKLIDNDPKLVTLELTHQRIDDAQARFLANALAENTQVALIVLSCFSIVDDGALALASVIGNSKKIRSVQLRDLRNSREVITFFKELARNAKLEELSLRHCQICQRSAKFLYELVENHPSLQELRLVDTQFVGGSLAHLCKGVQNSLSLKRLYLVNTEIDGDSGGRCLGSMLRTNETLLELYLCENQLGDEGMTFLVEGLAENTTLRKLDLRSNGIGVEGALSIASLVKKSNSLLGLYLGMNEIGDVGLEALAQGLTFGRLQKLDLSENGIGASGAEAISSMLQTNTSLQELNLSFNSIGDAGASSIANILDQNVTLRCLSLRRNRIGNEGACAFAAKLPTMRGLKELVMIKNSISQDGAAALLKGLRRNMELEYLHVEDKVSEPILREIVHWIRLNRAGRRIFRNTNLPATVWPEVLSNINCDLDVLYHFLREKPEVFQHSRKRKMSSH
jgi:Ran GTPase-activating protein (RanGAP) involved in mRNA processing and transport